MIDDFINEELVLIDPAVDNKRELFDLVSQYLAEKKYIKDKNKFFRSLISREELSNTEISPHIAIPHTYCRSVDKLFVTVILSRKGINFNHPGYGPVHIVFLFGCFERECKNYLRLLARSVRLLKNDSFKKELLNCRQESEVIRVLKTYDKNNDDLDSSQNYLMAITLYDKHHLTDLLTSMLEVGINNASIIQAKSMARLIAYELPVFAGLSFKSSRKNSEAVVVLSTLFGITQVQQLTSILKEQHFDLSKAGNGFIQIIKSKKLIGEVDEFI